MKPSTKKKLKKAFFGTMTIIAGLSLFVEMDVSTIPSWVFPVFKLVGLLTFVAGLILLGAFDNEFTK